MIRLRHAFLLSLVAVAACSGNDVRNTLGLNHGGPDEFVVYARPPLVVPPEFELTPPRPGEAPPHAVSTEQQARKLLLGTDGTGPGGSMSYDEFMNHAASEPAVETAVTPVLTSDAPTPAGAGFIRRLGLDTADPNIRATLQSEATTPPPGKKEASSLYEELLGEEQGEQVVDPAKESERLRANKDAGKPVTEGDTPSQDTTPKSVLERVF